MPTSLPRSPRRALTTLALCLAPWLAATPASAVDLTDTRLMADPTVSASHLAFTYAGDLWVAQLDGSGVRRLTSHPGRESRPRLSPDGRWVAFSGEYDGNVDVYLVNVAGGEPKRLTHHPDDDLVQGFTPDGRAVLFTSARTVFTRRHRHLFTVPVEGGFPTQLPIPTAWKAAYAPDGQTLAYQPHRDAFTQWKNYRGGTTARLWLYRPSDHGVVEVPQPAGRCNDTDPSWVGGQLYFRSDRAGEFNLFRYDPTTRAVTQLTHHTDFPVLAAQAGAGRIVYEQAGRLHLLDPVSGQSRALKIGISTDLPETRPRFHEAGGDLVRSASPSPSGQRVAFEIRGEIVTLPAEKGDPRVLTQTPGAHERSPVWSPQGDRIAWFSDETGEYQLVIAPQNGGGERRRYDLGGAGFYTDPKWSPDGTKISYVDNSRTIFWLDVASGKVNKVSSDEIYGPISTLFHSWSPDSRWLAYTRNSATYFQRIFLYHLADGTSTALTDGLADAAEPVFDASGKYLYFTASTDAGPIRDWFAQSSQDARATNAVYLVVLRAGEKSPLAAESDEEEGVAEKDKKDSKDKKDGEKEGEVRVDWAGISQRVVALETPGGYSLGLQTGKAGQLFYLRAEQGALQFATTPGTHLYAYDLTARKETQLAAGATRFELTAGGEKVLVRANSAWQIGATDAPLEAGKGALAPEKVQVYIDPRAEWRQIFHEAWRINRDEFYDPGMHGANWTAQREKYAPFLEHLTQRDDLNRLIQWMCSELAVGHHGVGGGDTVFDAKDVPGGLLGADYRVENNRYRFAKVYGGPHWDPTLRAPLTAPGVDVRAGEYLLAVDGRELTGAEEIYARFENTAGHQVSLTVGPTPDGKGARTVTVVPLRDENGLRNRDWVEGNVAKVTAATNGRVAYVWVPDTGNDGFSYFKRYFYPQSNREAIIVDERFNGGGLVADYVIDLLRRPPISHWAMRYGQDLASPLGAIQGPKVMLIDETAGSGGDLLPWMFRRFQLGTLVGRRTWGGLVGVLGFPGLMDGGNVTAPNLGFWTADGFGVENEGVPPDVEVEQWPADIAAGRDPQLEKAIEIALAQLAANPPKKPTRPAFPVRARPPVP